MYKGASSFRQRLRDSGRSLTNQRKKTLSGKPRTKLARKLDRSVEEAKLTQWLVYIRQCKECTITPQVPEKSSGS